jgi:hypothetical protein
MTANEETRGVRAVATYCSRMTNRSHDLIPAIDRWGNERVRQAQRIATKANRQFFLLTTARGLIPAHRLVPPDPTSLKEGELNSKADLVVRELKQYRIESLLFFANPLERERMNFVRLILLACERSNPKVALELADHDGGVFSDWSTIMAEANQAKHRTLNTSSQPVSLFFDLLTTKYPEDGMVWYRLAESHEHRKDFHRAQEAYSKARELFHMKEWKNLARAAEDRIKSLRRSQTHTGLLESEIALVSRLLITDSAIKVLSLQALRLLGSSPVAAVALSRTVLIRIIRSLDASALDSTRKDYLNAAIDLLKTSGRISQMTADDMHSVRMRRNDIEFASTLPNTEEARFSAVKLVEILKRLYPLR